MPSNQSGDYHGKPAKYAFVKHTSEIHGDGTVYYKSAKSDGITNAEEEIDKGKGGIATGGRGIM